MHPEYYISYPCKNAYEFDGYPELPFGSQSQQQNIINPSTHFSIDVPPKKNWRSFIARVDCERVGTSSILNFSAASPATAFTLW